MATATLHISSDDLEFSGSYDATGESCTYRRPPTTSVRLRRRRRRATQFA